MKHIREMFAIDQLPKENNLLAGGAEHCLYFENVLEILENVGKQKTLSEALETVNAGLTKFPDSMELLASKLCLLAVSGLSNEAKKVYALFYDFPWKQYSFFVFDYLIDYLLFSQAAKEEVKKIASWCGIVFPDDGRVCRLNAKIQAYWGASAKAEMLLLQGIAAKKPDFGCGVILQRVLVKKGKLASAVDFGEALVGAGADIPAEYEGCLKMNIFFLQCELLYYRAACKKGSICEEDIYDALLKYFEIMDLEFDQKEARIVDLGRNKKLLEKMLQDIVEACGQV